MKKIEKKVLPEYYKEIRSHRKMFELRKDDSVGRGKVHRMPDKLRDHLHPEKLSGIWSDGWVLHPFSTDALVGLDHPVADSNTGRGRGNEN